MYSESQTRAICLLGVAYVVPGLLVRSMPLANRPTPISLHLVRSDLFPGFSQKILHRDRLPEAAALDSCPVHGDVLNIV